MVQDNARRDCYFIHWLYEQGFAGYICCNSDVKAHPYDCPCTEDCKGYFNAEKAHKIVLDAINNE